MLAMEHRISDDIDLFLRDPQWIGFLTPRLNDRFEHLIAGYDEGATSLKLKFPDGEIDFIVGMSLLGHPDEHESDCQFPLEPVSEVLAKKLFYRGWAMTPRDLFDWWSIEQRRPDVAQHSHEIASLVAPRAATISAALQAMKSSEHAQLKWQSIRAPDLPDLPECIKWAAHRIEEFKTISTSLAKSRGESLER